MTRRGRSVLALGVVVYLAAWAFGSKPLYPVAAGLLLAVAFAWGWVHLANGPFRAHRNLGEREHVEGDDVQIAFAVEPAGLLPPPAAALVERVGRLGDQRHPLRRRGRRLAITYVLEGVRRGRYVFEDSRVELSDPFGLQRVSAPLPAPGALLVYPRLVHLERLFSESGVHALEGRRLLLRRPTGFDLHSVREYERGESLRHVHWRSTARRGQLMVKELEDAPRDEIAVLLDADAATVAGESFDVQVRAAGSILDAYLRHGRRVILVVNSDRRESQQVRSPAVDSRRALELLAAVEPTGRVPVHTLMSEEGSPAARSLELVVVTARVERALVDRLVQRALSRRKAALVFVDAPTFAGAPPQREPALLRLQAAGVAVAVIRAGDDLAAALEGARAAEAVHG
ncbi:MAG: DUF58 domain-containing protein [Gaiellaceae bacterium]